MGTEAKAAAKEDEVTIYRDIGFGSAMLTAGALITYGVMKYRDSQKTDDFHRIWSASIHNWQLQMSTIWKVS